jgi:membrane-associated phospholipid phosphatase
LPTVCGATWAIAAAVALQTGPPGTIHTSSAWPDDRPVIRFIPNLAQDVKALSSKTTLLVAAGGTIVSFSLSAADDEVAAYIAKQDGSGWGDIGAVLGGGWVQGAAALFTYGVGRLYDSPKVTHTGSDLVRAQILNGLLVTGLKVTVDRKRPDGGGYSFPSGHTAAAFASASVLHGHFGWKVGAPAYSVAAFIAWSRMRDGQHWLSDLGAGATIGVIVGQAVTSGHRERTWTVVPTPIRGGFALFVSKTR